MNENREKQRRLFYVYKIALVASVGGFLFGYDLVIISGALLFLEKHFHLTAAMKGFVVSSALLGAISGPLIGLWFADRIGRRKTMLVAALFFMVSTIGCALAVSVWDFCFWRFLGGIGIGLAMMSSPIYIAELAPADQRGRLVNVNQLSNVIGINMAVIVSYFLSFDGDWRWMFGSQGVPVLLLMVGLMLIPESPRWLVEKGRLDEALRILTRINGSRAAEIEFKEIEQAIAQEEGGFRDLFNGGNKRALIVGTILMVLSQVNGVNMMLLYAPTILAQAGISVGSSAILSSIPVYLFIFVCTLLAFPLIRKYPRKGLLNFSFFLMGAGHVAMAVILYLDMPPLSILFPMLLATGAFTLGLAPLSWVIVSEIFPNKIRGKAMGVVCFFLYASSFAIAQVFPVMSEWFENTYGNTAGMYLIFTAICWSGVVFSWRMLPETSGVRLEELDKVWNRH
ncbi:sugar porter family MFS transporter [Ravibacter arvi]|uniref:Sugar porter family MFS transporter n=1 Tax=Ravibacter arvi TaxID=2051041 RepID=A0ABP8LXF9_9BACT